MKVLRGLKLAEKMFRLGLAPEGTYVLKGVRDRYKTRYLRDGHRDWCPWLHIEDVWHLVLQYEMSIVIRGNRSTIVVSSSTNPGLWGKVPFVSYDMIPTLIGNVALWCKTQEEKR